MLPNKVYYVELVELYMLDFDVILGMEWLNSFFASIYCRTRVVKFNFPNRPVVEWKGVNSIPRVCIISCIKSCKIISKGCVYHIVRVQDLDSEIPPIESVLVVREFPEVFPNDIPVILPERKLILLLICCRIQILFQFVIIGWLHPN